MSVIKTSMVSLMDNIGEAILDKIVGGAKVLVGQTVNAIKGLLRGPLPSQTRATWGVAAILNEVCRVALLNADPGTGKSLMGIATTTLLAGKKDKNIVVLAPPTLCEKWEAEIVATLPSATVIQCEGKQALAIFRTEITKPKLGLRFFVVADTTNRRHYHSIKPTLQVNRSARLAEKLDEIAIHQNGCLNLLGDVLARCPKCGQLFKKNVGTDGEYRFLTVEQMERKTAIRCKHIDPHTKRECGEIWRSPVTTRTKIVEVEAEGEVSEEVLSNPHMMAREISVAYWAKKHVRRSNMIDLLIGDEIHRAKEDGAHGEATRWFCNAASKVLMLTGTLTGGYAKDLFHLLFIANPKGMRKLGYRFSDLSRFCSVYGASEVKTWVEGLTLRGKERKKTVSRHRPGISANVYPDLLMDRSVFLSKDEIKADLRAMGISCPDPREFLETVPMNEEMKNMYDFVTSKFSSELARLIKAAGKTPTINSLVSKSIAVRASWVDRLQTDTIDGVVDDGKGNKITVSIPMFDYEPEGPTPKEARMIEIIRQNKAAGRKVLVFISYSDKRDCGARMAKIFGEAGINAIVLGKQISARKREQWIADQVKAGIDVMITNPERVKEGYDLVSFPTIISAQPTLNLFTHRQAMDRPDRPIIQREEVHRHFLAYEDTIQEQLLVLAASKLDSALLAEGNLQESAMLDISQSQDSIMRELIKAVVDGNEHLLKLPATTVVPTPVTSASVIPPVVVDSEETAVPWAPALLRVVTRVTEIFRRKPKVVKVPEEQLALFEFSPPIPWETTVAE